MADTKKKAPPPKGIDQQILDELRKGFDQVLNKKLDLNVIPKLDQVIELLRQILAILSDDTAAVNERASRLRQINQRQAQAIAAIKEAITANQQGEG